MTRHLFLRLTAFLSLMVLLSTCEQVPPNDSLTETESEPHENPVVYYTVTMRAGLGSPDYEFVVPAGTEFELPEDPERGDDPFGGWYTDSFADGTRLIEGTVINSDWYVYAFWKCCGNGKIEPELDEECDDGNTVSGDGCTDDCRLE